MKLKLQLAGGAILLLLSGCLNPPNQEQDFGPETPKSEIELAFSKLEGPSAYSIKKGEFSYLERAVQIESNNPEIIYQRAETITQKVEEPDQYVLTIVTEESEKIDGYMKPSKSEGQAYLKKPTSLLDVSAIVSRSLGSKVLSGGAIQNRQSLIKNQSLNVNSALNLKISASSFKSTDSTDSSQKAPLAESERMTYHNLKVVDINYPTPELVKKRANCSGLDLKICQDGIKAKEVSFDKVTWSARGGDRASYRFIASSQVPYFASQLLACVHSRVDYSGQRVNVLQCEHIRDFRFGSDTDSLTKNKK